MKTQAARIRQLTRIEAKNVLFSSKRQTSNRYNGRTGFTLPQNKPDGDHQSPSQVYELPRTTRVMHPRALEVHHDASKVHIGNFALFRHVYEIFDAGQATVMIIRSSRNKESIPLLGALKACSSRTAARVTGLWAYLSYLREITRRTRHLDIAINATKARILATMKPQLLGSLCALHKTTACTTGRPWDQFFTRLISPLKSCIQLCIDHGEYSKTAEPLMRVGGLHTDDMRWKFTFHAQFERLLQQLTCSCDYYARVGQKALYSIGLQNDMSLYLQQSASPLDFCHSQVSHHLWRDSVQKSESMYLNAEKNVRKAACRIKAMPSISFQDIILDATSQERPDLLSASKLSRTPSDAKLIEALDASFHGNKKADYILRLSPSAEDKLGLGRFRISISPQDIDVQQVLGRLNKFCRSASATGLDLAFQVRKWLVAQYPKAYVCVISQHRALRMRPIPGLLKPPAWYFRIHKTRTHLPDPMVVRLIAHFTAKKYTDVAVPMSVDLRLIVDQTRSPVSLLKPQSKRYALLTELELMLGTALQTIDRVCEDLVFESYTHIPQAICEALLSMLSFSSPIGEVVRVRTECTWNHPVSGLIVEDYYMRKCSDQHEEVDSGSDTHLKTNLGSQDQESSEQAIEEMKNTSPTVYAQEPESSSAKCGTNDQEQQEIYDKEKASIAEMHNENQALAQSQSDAESMLREDDYAGVSSSLPESSSNGATPQYGGVYLALGSNVGDRIEAIESACRIIDADPDMKLLRISPLYETAPMYVEDQAPFLNGVCEIETKVPPMELLDKLQAIEQNLGRVKMIDKGPRNIDLDILLYRSQTVQTERLTIPHALMLEREFVLRPLSHIYDRNTALVPTSELRLVDYLERLDPQEMYTVTALSNDNLRPARKTTPTLTMAILNTTPDSFSDGGDNQPSEIDTLQATVAAQIAAGAAIIDVGGQSSRPNAPDITAEEEIARVVPVIKAIKALTDAKGVLISIDTYRSSVAKAAVYAGAHIVNDISAGQLDPVMLATVSRLGCTYIMMHMRGTPSTMQSNANCLYPDGVLPTVRTELLDRVAAAEAAGIFPWRIILDPGVGFSKTVTQNLELLTGLAALRDRGPANSYPWLVGSSRKGFIGNITGVRMPKDRVMGTSATVTAAIMGGADIIRVHDVAAMVEVAKMADAMYQTA